MNHRFRLLWLFLVVSANLATAVFPAKLPAEEKIHLVQRGDTIYSLARSYGVSDRDILSLNGIDDPGRILVGQRIRIPVAAKAAATASVAQPLSPSVVDHRVAKDETLYGIARKYGVTRKAICSANGIPETYMVKTGEVLRIPQAGAAITKAPAPSAKAAEPAPKAAPELAPLGNFTGTEVRSTVSRSLDRSVSWPIMAREMAYMTGKLNGVVLVGERNEPVRSLAQGTVISAGPYRGFGKVVIVQVTGGYLYVYGGCESLSVREGDRVKAGMELGRLGMDALSDKPQLFLLVYRNNVSVDPATAPRS